MNIREQTAVVLENHLLKQIGVFPQKLTNICTIDAFGRIKAQIADLKKIEKELKAKVVAMGVGEHDGELFRATVSVADRETLDMEAVREKLSPQFIAAHTNTKEVTTVRVVARK